MNFRTRIYHKENITKQSTINLPRLASNITLSASKKLKFQLISENKIVAQYFYTPGMSLTFQNLYSQCKLKIIGRGRKSFDYVVQVDWIEL